MSKKFIRRVINMDVTRAKVIASSPIMANVSYNGKPIYIKNVNENSNTASIYPLDEPYKSQEVSLNNLVERLLQ